ncbi:MAG TPA: DUF6544 family protein [Longimicrobiales bacterium]|nr:DUF6544 family protein [Longimicrobiales bacterium]
MRVLTVLVAAAATLVVVAVVTVLVATALWNRTTERVKAELEIGSRAPEGLTGLDTASTPPMVARYLSRALPAGVEPVGMATLVQEGTFQMGKGDAGWKPFHATQHVRAYPPGFLWDASIGMMPLIPVRVRDGYLDGAGMMKGAVACLITVVEAAPTRELAEGSLYRYLAEAVWMPSRLLPGDGLSWDVVDDSTARATLRDGDVEVSVLFGFDAAGDIVSMLVPERGREVDGEHVPTPWKGRVWDHQVVGGYRVPLQGEVAWVVDGVEVPYWRGRITSATYR